MFAYKEVYGNIEFSDIDKIKIIAFCQKHPDKDMALKLKKEGDHYIIASSRASKDDGEVFAQEVLQVLKKQESRWFQDIETFMIDRELFLVYLSQLLFDIPALINIAVDCLRLVNGLEMQTVFVDKVLGNVSAH